MIALRSPSGPLASVTPDEPARRVVSQVCQVTGAQPGFGHHDSHRRTKRRSDVDVQRKHYWVPSLGRHVTLRVSAHGIETVDRRDIT